MSAGEQVTKGGLICTIKQSTCHTRSHCQAGHMCEGIQEWLVFVVRSVSHARLCSWFMMGWMAGVPFRLSTAFSGVTCSHFSARAPGLNGLSQQGMCPPAKVRSGSPAAPTTPSVNDWTYLVLRYMVSPDAPGGDETRFGSDGRYVMSDNAVATKLKGVEYM